MHPWLKSLASIWRLDWSMSQKLCSLTLRTTWTVCLNFCDEKKWSPSLSQNPDLLFISKPLFWAHLDASVERPDLERVWGRLGFGQISPHQSPHILILRTGLGYIWRSNPWGVLSSPVWSHRKPMFDKYKSQRIWVSGDPHCWGFTHRTNFCPLYAFIYANINVKSLVLQISKMNRCLKVNKESLNL